VGDHLLPATNAIYHSVLSMCRSSFVSQSALEFAYRHRHTTAHSCPAPGVLNSKNEAARAVLVKNFSSQNATTAPQRRTKIPLDPKKLAQYQKVQLMKMRHSAIPANPKDKSSSTPVDQRLHVKVQLVGLSSEITSNEKVFWFRKVNHIILYRMETYLTQRQSVVTGKALDMVASQFGISSSVRLSCHFLLCKLIY
jgi:hypothetical protein